MVDDEARRGAKAARSEALAVSVAGQDEDVHAVGGGHDLAFDSPASGLERAWPIEARACFGEQPYIPADRIGASGVHTGLELPPGTDQFHYYEQPMHQQFRFAGEGQSRSNRLLARRSSVCEHKLCRFGSNSVAMSRAAGSDEL